MCSCRSSGSVRITENERELRKRAMKLDLAPLLGKAYRYVTVNKNGECKEIDEGTVRERRESFLKQAPDTVVSVTGPEHGIQMRKVPMKKLRKPRQMESTNAEIDFDARFSKPDWLPESFTVMRITNTHVSGWVNTEEDLAQALNKHSDAFSCKFVSWYQGKGPSNSFDSKRIAWKREDIEPDCPFVISSYLVRHCPYGMKMKRLSEIRESYKEPDKREEGIRGPRTCHARLKIRRVTLYEDFRLNPEDKTKKIMWEKMACVKEMVNKGQEVSTSSRIYMQLPLPAAHTSHAVPGLEGRVKTEMSCQPGSKEIDDTNIPQSLKQGDLVFSASKFDMEEMNATSPSLSDTFRVEDMPVSCAGSNIDHWRMEHSFGYDSTSEGSQGSGKKEEKNNEKFKFEIRPPQKRTHILASCKVDCPARIKVKRISLYERFRLEEGDNRRKKDDKMMMVKDMINNGSDGLEATPAIFMQLPLADGHKNHQVSTPMTNSQQFLINPRHPPHQQLQHHTHLSWLPEYFMITSCEAAYVTGWVRTELEYLQVLEKHRLAFGCSFLAWSNDKERTFKAEADRRVMWKKDFIDPGCPLTVHHSLILACAYSDQNKGRSDAPFQQNQTTDLSCLAQDFGENIIQVPSDFVQDGTSLEIQYCDAAHQYPELQSLIKPDETYIILVENS